MFPFSAPLLDQLMQRDNQYTIQSSLQQPMIGGQIGPAMSAEDLEQIDPLLQQLQNIPIQDIQLIQDLAKTTPKIETKRSTNIPDEYFTKLMKVESSNNPLADAPTSSAAGAFQFIDKTWKNTVKEMGRDYKLNDRYNPVIAKEVAEFFTEQNRKQLKSFLDREPNYADLYSAHFLGPEASKKFLMMVEDDPSQNASRVFPKEAAANKPVFYKLNKEPRTIKEVYDYFKKRFK